MTGWRCPVLAIVYSEVFDLFPMGGKFDSLFPFPRPEVDCHLLLQMIEGNGVEIRLQDEMFPHRPGRRRILVAVKDHGKIFVRQDRFRFPAIGQSFR